MANLASPMIRPFRWASNRPGAVAIAQRLPALLKVRTLHALLITLLVVTQYWFELASSLSDRPRLLAETFLALFERNVLYWLVAFAGIAVVQARIAPGRVRALVLVAGAVLWSEFVWPRIVELFDPFLVVELGLATQAGQAADGSWTAVTYLLLALWCYESADRAAHSMAARRQSELVRHRAERWLLELRLGSLQARLDPKVLFDTLDEAGRLYRSRPAAAERLLDALIGYLRQALPKLRQPQSTLAREVALASAYLRLLRTREGETLEVDAVIEPAADDACFPSMVMQPLCDALARSVLTGRGPARIRISAARDQDSVCLQFSADPVSAEPPRERLAEIRHTLLAMFGPLARLDAPCATAGVVRVVVEVPYDAASRIDR